MDADWDGGGSPTPFEGIDCLQVLSKVECGVDVRPATVVGNEGSGKLGACPEAGEHRNSIPGRRWAAARG